MTKFQTAQENPYSTKQSMDAPYWSRNAPVRGYHDYDVSAIVPLHDEPEPDYMDTFISSSIDPETALILLEELGGDNSEMPAYEYIEEVLENTAPTTNNIKE
tara:strand:+ start:113 stop:418 length:306 start_codon:yes stop_codon:yes gene_type:complete